MKKTLLIVGLIGLILSAPISSVSESQDSRSTALLNKLSKTYKSYKSVKAQFTVNIRNKQANTSVKQSGTLYQKGKKFRVNMSGQEIFCDGKTIWTYLEDANEVQISKFDAKSMDINPSEIFTIYEKGFMHKYAGQVTNGTKTLDVVELTPIDKNKGYFKVKLGIDKLANKVKEMSVFSKNGLITTYVISKFEPNVNINDSYFKFNPKDKPGVIEIDLR
ncbi:outer membrane lipoprotein carrier protein LolA [Bacteroidia bacterium]|jgi:outer membrane lipoprotein-sorting protein|nr:outer membrane lipoprotein carrier protein LolA [Bacteroidota bacterium]MDA8930001.1 outer membrane lipoprotein carrier protein LolA [Bacteroidia bacterium]MDB4173969.1 outer membrane lipoprotein carrier protein LolA [Bacteroidia bacterium]